MKLNIPYPNISTRITLPFLLVIIIIAGVAVFVVTRLVAGSVQERFTNQLVDSARAARNAIVDIETQILETLRAMVFTQGIVDSLEVGDVADIDLALRPLTANSAVDSVLVFDRVGRALLHLTRSELPNGGAQVLTADLPDLSTWQGIRSIVLGTTDGQGDKFLDIDPNYTGGYFYVSAPIVSDDGLIIGGISVGLNKDRFIRDVAAQSLSAIVLLDLNGMLLATTFRAANNATINLTAEQVNTIRAALQDGLPIEEFTANDTQYQVLYAPFEMRGALVGLLGAALPTNFIVESSGTSRNVFSVLFATMFVAIAILGLLVARTITRPVQRLVATTRSIREGDLSQRVLLSLPDELGELSVSFDHMTDQLVEKNATLQGLYQQREAVLRSISDAVIVEDMQGNILLANHTGEELLRSISTRPSGFRRLLSILQNPERYEHLVVVDIEDRHFNVVATTVYQTDGTPLGYVIVLHDITALIEAERVKDKMMLQLSHELRTPLAGARGFIELLAMTEQARISSKGATFIERANLSLGELERMVNQVIDVSALVSNQFDIESHPFDLMSVLRSVAEEWQPYAEQRGLKFTFGGTLSELMVSGDDQRIGQVVDHLLRNACNYTLAGGSVGLFVDCHETMARITVADNGVGIDSDEADRVFERAYRGRSADAGPTDARGLGFGLYLARAIVELHSGTITLRSKPQVGTVVTVLLPMTLQPA